MNADNGRKLLLSIGFILLVILCNRLLTALVNLFAGERVGRLQFWTRQGIRILTAAVTITGLVSIWFNDPGRLAQVAGPITVGLAIASQRVITALAAYLIILRGKDFNVVDRIVMGGVRGDVIALGFMQTTIMEMRQPAGEQGDAPSMWVAGGQYTGRIVTITNDKIFDTPVYNYTRDFPYIWEEMRLPIPYSANRKAAEQLIVDAGRRHTAPIAELGEEALKELERRYEVKREELEPRVYYRITDNWCEMAVRFIAEDHGVRKVKDAMSREILDELEAVKIGIASGTYEVVGMPELKVPVTGDTAPH